MSWTHIEDVTRKASKEHECMLCECPIPAKSQYIERTGVEDGEGFIRFRMHVLCASRTAEWGADEWENRDAFDFRVEWGINHDLRTYVQRRVKK